MHLCSLGALYPEYGPGRGCQAQRQSQGQGGISHADPLASLPSVCQAAFLFTSPNFSRTPRSVLSLSSFVLSSSCVYPGLRQCGPASPSLWSKQLSMLSGVLSLEIVMSPLCLTPSKDFPLGSASDKGRALYRTQVLATLAPGHPLGAPGFF